MPTRNVEHSDDHGIKAGKNLSQLVVRDLERLTVGVEEGIEDEEAPCFLCNDDDRVKRLHPLARRTERSMRPLQAVRKVMLHPEWSANVHHDAGATLEFLPERHEERGIELETAELFAATDAVADRVDRVAVAIERRSVKLSLKRLCSLAGSSSDRDGEARGLARVRPGLRVMELSFSASGRRPHTDTRRTICSCRSR